MSKSFSKEFAVATCKLFQMEKCCSYLASGPDGMECLKGTSLEKEIVKRRKEKSMNAMGDNCDGYNMTPERKIDEVPIL